MKNTFAEERKATGNGRRRRKSFCNGRAVEPALAENRSEERNLCSANIEPKPESQQIFLAEDGLKIDASEKGISRRRKEKVEADSERDQDQKYASENRRTGSKDK